MALAILEWMDVDDSQVWFRIDTGTNTHYQLKVGREVREDADGEYLEDVYLSLPLARTEAAGDLFGGPQQISVPLERFERGRGYAQLSTFKEGGRAQTTSDVVALPGLGVGTASFASSLSTSEPVVRMNANTQAHKAPRRIPNCSPALARSTSLESLLGEIVKIASPVVMDLLKGAAGKANGSGDGKSGDAQTTGGPTDLLGQVLNSLLGALSGTPAKVETPKVEEPAKVETPAKVEAPANADLSKPKSIARMNGHGAGNRFVAGGARFAEPMIFGIDDALLASLAGPIIQVLPQLANAANQKRIELKKADNLLTTTLVSEINKRLMMDKLLEAQTAAQKQGPGAQLDPAQLQALVELLAQVPAGTSTTKSLMTRALTTSEPGETHKLSNRAALEFILGRPVMWNGSERTVFDRNRAAVMKIKFVVAEPVPKAPLPKAILKVVIQDAANPDVRAEKICKLSGVVANAALECALQPADLAQLPQNTPLTVLAELRWLTARGESRAYGSTELVLVNRYFLKSRGSEVSAERELTDMNRYRAFWNKVWEAPVLNGAPRGGTKKYNWELDVTAKYATVLTGSKPSNGLMETRLLQDATDPASLIQLVRGRMKAGIELSVAELNKLIPGWEGHDALDPSKLEALNSPAFLDEAARELKSPLKLKGRAGQGGMVWAIPTFKLFGLTLSSVAGSDESGQVNATTDEVVPFPLPVAARLIGLKSAA